MMFLAAIILFALSTVGLFVLEFKKNGLGFAFSIACSDCRNLFKCLRTLGHKLLIKNIFLYVTYLCGFCISDFAK